MWYLCKNKNIIRLKETSGNSDFSSFEIVQNIEIVVFFKRVLTKYCIRRNMLKKTTCNK
jgi:hypothetical protein